MPALEPDSAFVGTWEMTSLSTWGRPRPGRRLLVVEPGKAGKPAVWTWDPVTTRKMDLVTTRKPGQPLPTIRRKLKYDPRSFAHPHYVEEGVYRLEGDTLAVSFLDQSALIRAGEDPFLPAARRSVEIYHRVRREPDLAYRPARFPTGPATLLATWDVAAHGVLQGAPRGIVSHLAAYDLGDGVHMIYMRGCEWLDDPPAPDVEEKDVPTGTIVRPAGGKFDAKTYEVAYLAQSPEAQAAIEAFRAQDPVPPDRERNYPFLFPKSILPGHRVSGWDGLLISARKLGDRTVADILVSPRVWAVSCHGNRVISSHSPALVETWELHDGKLRYLAGGPELPEEGGSSASPPAWPDPGVSPQPYTGMRTIPSPAHLPPVSKVPVFGTSVHYRPGKIDLEDSTRNSTEAGPPDYKGTHPEFKIHHAFAQVGAMPPPAARETFFEQILKTPGYTQSHWNAVIRSAKADGEEIRTEIVVWPQLAIFEDRRFRTIAVRPLIETWVYREGRLTFVSARAAPAKPAEGP